MKYILAPNTKEQLNNAVPSNCDGMRYGSEFCEHSIPDLEAVKQAYDLALEYGKKFSYSIPLLTNRGLDKIKPQLSKLKEYEDVEIVTGDLGIINLLRNNDEIHLSLGRSRVYIPGRSPWDQITRLPNPSFFTSRKVEKLFYQTSLNYTRVIQFFTSHNVTGADVDLIPKCFPNYRQLTKKGFGLSLHTHAIPVAVAMRCHTARFLNEASPETCTQPCNHTALTIKQKEVGKQFKLHGNVVYSSTEITRKTLRELNRIGVENLIIPMNPITDIDTTEDINEFIEGLSYLA